MTPTPPPDQSEFRHDVISGRWVAFAPERARRPLGNAKPAARQDAVRDTCPFCPGPGFDIAATVQLSPADGPWQVLVCPNKFPAVRPIAPTTRGLTVRLNRHLLPGFGVHEVVVEGQAHVSNPADLPDDTFARTLLVYRDRLRAFAADPRLDYAAVFKNVGAEAGASMAHSHSQVLATPFVPNDIRDELAGAADHHAQTGRCYFCTEFDPARDPDGRVIAESPRFVAGCPFAPRFAYEFWVLPKAHASGYDTLTDDEAGELTGLLKRCLRALDAAAGVPAYNVCLHTAPLRAAPSASYHWHLEVVPRTARPAGFEWGTGVFINTVTPERAARELRAAVPDRT